MLTAKRIAQLIKGKPGRHHDGHGLYLQVISPTNVSWVLKYQRGGREKMIGLGPLHAVGLSEARIRARDVRLSLLDNIDPIEQKKRRAAEATVAAVTFADCAREYYQSHKQGWSASTARGFLNSMERHAFPVLGNLAPRDVDTTAIMKVLTLIWSAKTATASNLRANIEAVLDAARVRGLCDGANPARWRGHIGQLLPARKRIAPPRNMRAMPFADVPSFMAELRERPGIAARALEFLILTATRREEAVAAMWDEIDLESALWTIPASRMKARREHRVPLAPRAIELLRSLPREGSNNFVFVARARGHVAGASLLVLLRTMGRNCTVHGFRSAFRDWIGECANFPREIAEAALAHVVGDATERAYRRGDALEKRRQLMAAWADYCGRVDNVVLMRVVP